MTEQTYKTRSRVNFSQSTKDKITCEVTFELIDGTKEEAIKGATQLLDLALIIAKEKSVQP